MFFFKEMATSEEDKKKFLSLCYKGDVGGVNQLLTQDPTLITYKDEETGEVNKKIKEINRKGHLKCISCIDKQNNV